MCINGVNMTSRVDIFQEVKNAILCVWQDWIDADDILLDEELVNLGLDSLDHINISIKLEEHYGEHQTNFDIQQDTINGWVYVRDIVECIEKKLHK